MKRFLQLALLFGAVLGLFGQGLAIARIPNSVVQQTRQISSDDCMQMMAQAKQEKREAPCKGMTLDCIAAMGCALPVAIVDPFVLPDILPIARSTPPLPATQPLTQRILAPEPEPPSLI